MHMYVNTHTNTQGLGSGLGRSGVQEVANQIHGNRPWVMHVISNEGHAEMFAEMFRRYIFSVCNCVLKKAWSRATYLEKWNVICIKPEEDYVEARESNAWADPRVDKQLWILKTSLLTGKHACGTDCNTLVNGFGDIGAHNKTATKQQSAHDSSTHSLTFSLPYSLTHSITCSRTRALTHSRTHSLTHSLSQSQPDLLTHSLILQLTYPHTHSPIDSLTHSPTHSLTHSLTRLPETHMHTHTHTYTNSYTHTHT